MLYELFLIQERDENLCKIQPFHVHSIDSDFVRIFMIRKTKSSTNISHVFLSFSGSLGLIW